MFVKILWYGNTKDGLLFVYSLISFAFEVVLYGSTSDENLHNNLLLQKRAIHIMLDIYDSKTQ